VSGKSADSYKFNYEYRNIQNLIIKLLGQDEKNSILVNCHFDSVSGSYGASDDAANCCVMLEILKVLSQKSERQKFSIVMLFNGAEEQGLLVRFY
jgi:Zn-dependent M28 family amino/carboxypeptidase